MDPLTVVFRAGAAVAAAVLLVGCVPSLQNFSAGRVGCSPAEIQVSAEQTSYGSTTWVATCNGVSYQCARNAVATGPNSAALDVSCTPMHGGAPRNGEKPAAAPRRAPSAAEATAAAAQVERVKVGETWFLRAHLAEQPFVLTLDAAPNREGTLELDWELPARAGGASRESCAAKILLDEGTRGLEFRGHEVKGDRETFRFFVKTSFLAELSASTRAAGRLCDDEWRLTDASRYVLAEYVARYQDELKLKAADAWTPPPCCAAGTQPCICDRPKP